MNWDDTLRRFADMARPACIYFLGGSVGIAPFLHADVALAGLSAAAFGGLIGARSFENATQIKATASTTDGTGAKYIGETGKPPASSRNVFASATTSRRRRSRR